MSNSKQSNLTSSTAQIFLFNFAYIINKLILLNAITRVTFIEILQNHAFLGYLLNDCKIYASLLKIF